MRSFSGFAVGLSLAVGLIANLAMPQTALAQRDAMSLLNAIDPYRVDGQVKGKVQLAGSGSVAALAQMWLETFKQFQADFSLEASGGGSETGLVHLAEKPGSMASVTRPMEPDDLKKLQDAGIQKPIAIVVALDALGIYVHQNNPLKQISPTDLQRIFCQQPQGGRVDTWAALGVTGPLGEKPVHVQTRGENSGTYTFTEKYLLGGLKIRSDAQVRDNNADLLKAISADESAIAVAPLYLSHEQCRPLAIQLDKKLIQPDEATIVHGGYPLVRPVILVFDSAGPEASVVANKEFLRFALSREGQMDVIKAGYFPLNPIQLRQQQDALGFERIR